MEQIVIEFVGDTSKVKSGFDLITKLEEEQMDILAEAKAMRERYNNAVAQNKKSLDSLGKSQSSVNNETQEFATNVKSVAKEIVATNLKKVADDTNKVASALQESSAKSQSLKAQLKELKAQISKTTDPAEVERLVRAAGAVADEIDDINEKVKNFSGNNIENNIRGIMDFAQGTLGAFTALEGGMALFGAESEDLQKTLVKLNAAMAVLQGLEQVSNTLLSESAAKQLIVNLIKGKATSETVAQTVATEAQTIALGEEVVATEAATVATEGWTASLLSNPITLIAAAIAVAVGAIYVFTKATNDEADAQDKANKKMAEQLALIKQIIDWEGKRTQSVVASKQAAIDVAKAHNDSTESILKKEQELAKYELDRANEYITRNKTRLEFYIKNKTQIIAQAEDLEQKLSILNSKTSLTPDEKKEKARYELLLGNSQTFVDAMEGILKTHNDKVVSYANSSNAIQEQQQQAYFDKIKAHYEKQVLEAQQGSQAQLEAQIAGIKSQEHADIAALENNAASADKRKLIEAQAQKDIADLRNQFAISQLQATQTVINNELKVVAKGSQDELNLRIQQVKNQADIDRQSLADTATKAQNEKLIIQAAQQEIIDLTKEFQTKRAQSQQNAIIAQNNAIIALQQEGSKAVLDAQISNINAQSELDKLNAKNQITNAEELNAKLAEIEANKTVSIKKAEQDQYKYISQLEDEHYTNQYNHSQAQLQLVIDNAKSSTKQIQSAQQEQIKNTVAMYDAQEVRAKEDYDNNILSYQQYADKIVEIEDKKNAEIQKGEKALYDYRKQMQHQIVEVTYSIAQNASDTLFSIWKQESDQQTNDRLSALESQKDAELDNANLTAAEKDRINKKYQSQQNAIKLQQWYSDRNAAASQALINGFLAASKALSQTGIAGFLQIAPILAQTALLEASILSQKPPKFEKGTPGNEWTKLGWKIVGEKGPELIWTPGKEKVVTANDTAKILSNYNIPHLTSDIKQQTEQYVGSYPAGGIDIDELADRIIKGFSDVVGSQQKNVFSFDKNGFTSYSIHHGNKRIHRNNQLRTK